MSDLNLLIWAKAQTSFCTIWGEHMAKQLIWISERLVMTWYKALTSSTWHRLFSVKLTSSSSVYRSVALHCRFGNKPHCQVPVCRNNLLLNVCSAFLPAKMATHKSRGVAAWCQRESPSAFCVSHTVAKIGNQERVRVQDKHVLYYELTHNCIQFRKFTCQMSLLWI